LLLAARSPAGHWEGELSSSALSTATAVFALSMHPKWRHDPVVTRGVEWLIANQNADGGWGDTVKSISNISTTALCWAALAAFSGPACGPFVAPPTADEIAPPAPERFRETVARAEAWLTPHAGGVDPDHLIPAIIKRYGKDHTFSVPILTMCALAGRLGTGREAWRRIPQLPFELAGFPQRMFKWLRLPVVSYALPALIAIGLVRHKNRPSRNPVALFARRLACRRALLLLEKIQPSSGGFLEATPLTSFVVMSLIGAGLTDHPVVHRGIEFLIRSARPDGSWPIDTNLATWVTTLAVNALAIDPAFHQIMPEAERRTIRDWLLDQQYTAEHPYTLADPGGWAWTHLPGGVPDADDTAGAMLALKNLGLIDDRTMRAAQMGSRWLQNVQNRDGGIPTFCRGWGKLPFDRSSADLTAHALRAWFAWIPDVPLPFNLRSAYRFAMPSDDFSAQSIAKAIHFLIQSTARADGSWVPLWFGNQHALEEENPTYGTARVMLAPAGWNVKRLGAAWKQGNRAVKWLLDSQNVDGGWGGARETPSSIEETALAIEALAYALSIRAVPSDSRPPASDSIMKGVAWLLQNTQRGTRFEPSPIGFYFAKLWYFEKLYPLIFTVAALNSVKGYLARRNEDPTTARTAPTEQFTEKK
jgi:squalene-hopene/tetraprenyl-beta-curcumene cyclase